MKIKAIISKMRRDFMGIFECENCGKTEVQWGYDDEFFQQKVIPEMVCKECGKKAEVVEQ